MNASMQYYHNIVDKRDDVINKISEYILELYNIDKRVFFVEAINDKFISIRKKENYNFSITLLFPKIKNAPCMMLFNVSFFGNNKEKLNKEKEKMDQEISTFDSAFKNSMHQRSVNFDIKNNQDFFYLLSLSNYDSAEALKKEFKSKYVLELRYDYELIPFQPVVNWLEFSKMISIHYLIHCAYFSIFKNIKLSFDDYAFLSKLKVSYLDFNQYGDIEFYENKDLFSWTDDGRLSDESKELLKLNHKT